MAYIALDDERFDFLWKDEDVREFDFMWNKGFSVWYMAEYFNRDPDEVAILVMDRIRKQKIKPRKTGLGGK